MKRTTVKFFSSILLLIGINTSLLAQVSVNTNGFPGAATDYVGWNATRLFPVRIEHKGNFPITFHTNGFQRMLMEKGLGTQVDGRIAYGNNLPGTFIPVDRVHLFEAASTGSVQVRFQNTNTGTAATDGYAIGTDNVNRVVNHTQFENREMRWLSPDARNAGAITEWMRIENNKTNIHTSNTPTDGYVGLNNSSPYFHIDGITPSHNGGELFLSFQNTDADDTRMG